MHSSWIFGKKVRILPCTFLPLGNNFCYLLLNIDILAGRNKQEDEIKRHGVDNLRHTGDNVGSNDFKVVVLAVQSWVEWELGIEH